MLRKINGLVIITGLFLLVTVNINAQVPRALNFGTPVQGYMAEGKEYWFNIRHNANTFVVVEISSGMDTYLEAYDSSSNLLMESDDDGDELNARIEMYITAGNTYHFKLRGINNEVSGPYSIKASLMPVPRPAELRLGNSSSAYLQDGTDQWYSVRPSANGFVVVEARSESFDTFLEAYDSSYNRIAMNDDGGGGSNARIELMVESGKTYLFKTRPFDRKAGGQYQIVSSFDALPVDTDRNTERSRAVPVKLGEAMQVYFLSPSESRWYRYDVPRANTMFVTQTRGYMDTVMSLYDSRGNLIAQDDDSGENNNAIISQRLNSGTVYIEVKTYSETMGRCTLHAETR
jgi:hypothetical protein